MLFIKIIGLVNGVGFKASLSEVLKILETVTAFANTEVGKF